MYDSTIERSLIEDDSRMDISMVLIEQYPKKMCFEVFGAEKIEQFKIQIGEELTVSFDVDARQWQDRWFNSFRAWNVTRSTTPQLATQSTSLSNSNNDDLPFGDFLADDSPF